MDKHLEDELMQLRFKIVNLLSEFDTMFKYLNRIKEETNGKGKIGSEGRKKRSKG